MQNDSKPNNQPSAPLSGESSSGSSMSDSMAPRTIAWLVEGREDYGVRRMVLSLSQGLRELGWRTPIIALDQGAFATECQELGLDVHNLGLGKAQVLDGSMLRKATSYLQLLRFQRTAQKKVAQKVQDLAADAIHVNWPNLTGIAGYAARINNIPCFWEMPNIVGGGYPFGINRRIYQRRCKCCGIWPLAISQFTANTLGGHRVKPQVLFLSCDAQRFDPSQVISVSREQLGIDQNAVVLLICARIGDSKGQDRILEAMVSLDQLDRSLHLLLLGGPTDDAFADSLRAMAHEAGAADRLHFIGNVPDPQRYYAMADIAINSRVDPEPFGLSVIEAMMMGRPVLVHALGGPAETVIDGVTGWHVHDASTASFAKGLRRVLSDRSRWPEMGQVARRHALENFTMNVQARRYVQIVEERLCK